MPRASRRSFIKTVGVGIGASALMGRASALSGFTEVSSPTSKRLYDVVQTARGPHAVGAGGRLLARTPTGWQIIIEDGIRGSGNALKGAAISDDGKNLWVCGGSGVVGQFDVEQRELTDYSKPNGIGNTWTDAAVTESAGSEHVVLVNGSGQLVRGDKNADGTMTWNSTQKPTGNGIYGVDFHTSGEGRICGGSGTVYDTNDGGATWSQIGISNLGKTMNDIAVVSDGDTSAVGSAGKIAEYDGSGWTVYSSSGSAIYSISRDGSAGIAGGYSGLIYERTSSGWDKYDTGLSVSHLWGASLASGSDYPDVIVGDKGTILERGSYSGAADVLDVKPASSSSPETLYSFDVYGNSGGGSNLENLDGDLKAIGCGCGYADNNYTLRGRVSGGDSVDSYTFAGGLDGMRIRRGSFADIDVFVNGSKVSPQRLTFTSWNKNSDVGTSKTLSAVTNSATGLYAVGGGGHVVARNSGSWDLIIENGPGSNGNNLYATDRTDGGSTIWFGGSSGALGQYDVENQNLTDRGQPSGVSSTWESMSVLGAAGSETIVLGSGAGEILKGQNSSGSVTWGSPFKPGTGSAIRGMTFLTDKIGFIVDTNGDVFKTTDAGDSWTNIGMSINSGTPYDIDATSETDIAVSAGSGYIYQYNGATWTERTLAGNALRGIDMDADRTVTASGSGGIYRRALFRWEKSDDFGPTTFQDVTMDTDTLSAVVVGANGTVIEQTLDMEVF